MSAAVEPILAIDLGAESGRAVLGSFDGARLSLKEIHRFANVPVNVGGSLRWDVLALFGAIVSSLRQSSEYAGRIASVGVDSWGVDFGLLDASGNLLGNPAHYRDRRTEGMLEEAFRRVPKAEIYARTGIQFLPINSLYQLLSMVVRDDPQLRVAETFITMPSLFSYWLCGVATCELTDASTTQCLDVQSRTWATDILDRMGVPSNIFKDLVQPGTSLGRLVRQVIDSPGLSTTRVILPATHDTASAVAAVPFRPGMPGAFISSGTWSLVGVEVDRPYLESQALDSNLTNEIGVFGTVRLLRNVMGLWLIQECMRSWAAAGQALDYSGLTKLAEHSSPMSALIDPDDDLFLFPGRVLPAIAQQCHATGQREPKDPGDVVRVVLESLALKYRWVLDRLEIVTGQRIVEVHVVGGGANNRLLCQLTANACGRPVWAGPVEATAIGNILLQAIALGHVSSLTEARTLVADSFPMEYYEPVETENWARAYERFRTILAERAAVAREM